MPTEIVGQVFDFTRDVGSATITAGVISVFPTGTSLVAGTVSVVGSTIVAHLSGGDPGVSYALSASAAMSDGRRLVRQVYLFVSASGGDLPIPVPQIPTSPVGLSPGSYYTYGDFLCAVQGGLLPTSSENLAPGSYYTSGNFVCVTPGGWPLPVATLIGAQPVSLVNADASAALVGGNNLLGVLTAYETAMAGIWAALQAETARATAAEGSSAAFGAAIQAWLMSLPTYAPSSPPHAPWMNHGVLSIT